MHRVHHQLERRIDQAARVLRVEVLDQLHRALDVGEQRGHVLALTVERFRRATLRRNVQVERPLNLAAAKSRLLLPHHL